MQFTKSFEIFKENNKLKKEIKVQRKSIKNTTKMLLERASEDASSIAGQLKRNTELINKRYSLKKGLYCIKMYNTYLEDTLRLLSKEIANLYSSKEKQKSAMEIKSILVDVEEYCRQRKYLVKAMDNKEAIERVEDALNQTLVHLVNDYETTIEDENTLNNRVDNQVLQEAEKKKIKRIKQSIIDRRNIVIRNLEILNQYSIHEGYGELDVFQSPIELDGLILENDNEREFIDSVYKNQSSSLDEKINDYSCYDEKMSNVHGIDTKNEKKYLNI